MVFSLLYYFVRVCLEENGHFVLRSPVRHCELNPIELIWAEMKRFVACRNTTFKMKDVRNLTNEAIQSITVEAWQGCVDNVLSIEDKLCALEGIFETIDPVIISFSSDESSDDSNSDSDSDSESDFDSNSS